eukprot:m.13593 g.13593  ORF g.13593 m.13593 type:complete len:202 (+) comp5963_c0_seq2:32-637(+)
MIILVSEFAILSKTEIILELRNCNHVSCLLNHHVVTTLILSARLTVKMGKRAKKRKSSGNGSDGAPTPTKEAQSTRVWRSLQYLQQWKEDRASWKFKKARQVVLLANMYNPYAINAEDFEVLLEYLGNLQGHSLHVTLTEARSWFEDEEKPLMEEWTTSALREYAKHNDEPISDEDKGKLLSLLRQVVQCRAQQILFQLSA